jgi:hypothetical protein
MLSFKEIRSRIRIEGFQCHHLIPIQVVEKAEFSIFFGNLRAISFDPQDFISNGIHLPCTEEMAIIFGLPLHRGGHPQYNKMVAEQISVLQSLTIGEAFGQVRLLQSTLKRGLRRNNMLRQSELSQRTTDFRILEQEANALYGFLQNEWLQ